ncbi:MAG: tetraacyldisaccharide 4'-kinase [Hyphomicrobiales bacterium]
MSLVRLILFPFAILYGMVVSIRNSLFNIGAIRSKIFNIPVIVVGNLSAGGTGKTPHVEYLIRLLRKEYKLFTLSRGYGRKTNGFLVANNESTYKDIGDEPLQYHVKFSDVGVAVDGNRCRGISNILESYEDTDVILLDDAYQHRYVKPGLSILLTDYHNIYSQDFLLPTGYLREHRRGAKRADIIVVTKTPKIFSPITRRRLFDLIKPLPHQSLFFSYIDYGKLTTVTKFEFDPNDRDYNTIILFTGIANSYPLKEYLRNFCEEIVSIDFADHHSYEEKDINRIKNAYEAVFSKRKLIVTTEKDYMRLLNSKLLEAINYLPICYVPIEIKFHKGKEENVEFDNQIQRYVESNPKNS